MFHFLKCSYTSSIKAVMVFLLRQNRYSVYYFLMTINQILGYFNYFEETSSFVNLSKRDVKLGTVWVFGHTFTVHVCRYLMLAHFRRGLVQNVEAMPISHLHIWKTWCYRILVEHKLHFLIPPPDPCSADSQFHVLKMINTRHGLMHLLLMRKECQEKDLVSLSFS